MIVHFLMDIVWNNGYTAIQPHEYTNPEDSPMLRRHGPFCFPFIQAPIPSCHRFFLPRVSRGFPIPQSLPPAFWHNQLLPPEPPSSCPEKLRVRETNKLCFVTSCCCFAGLGYRARPHWDCVSLSPVITAEVSRDASLVSPGQTDSSCLEHRLPGCEEHSSGSLHEQTLQTCFCMSAHQLCLPCSAL